MSQIHIVKLSRWHRRVVVWTSLALIASGLVWMALHYGIEFAPDFDGVSARAWLHTILQFHGVVAYGAAIVFGTLLGRHIPSALRGRPWRWSGVALMVLASGLIVTGLLLYYAAGEEVRSIASFAHQGFGVSAIAFAASHFRRRRQAAAPASSTEPSTATARVA